MFKRIFACCIAAAMTGTLLGCSTKDDSAEIERTPTVFDQYVSNTVVATGHNTILETVDNVSYRAYFPVEEAGEFEYCFYFSNTVDSTWDDGELAYAGKSGGSYQILSASISDGGTSIEDEITNTTAVTFSGAASKDVQPDETFWSDPVTFHVPEGHYLVWEWTIQGTDVPCITMSNMTNCFQSKDGGEFIYANETPLPVLIGCDRQVKGKIAAFGDSITQGCQTSNFSYQFWAAKIQEQMGTDYSLWNLGLGYARASDAAMGGDWLERAKAYETVLVAFGTNDLYSGTYGGDGPDTAEEIEASLRTILAELTGAGCHVILFNAPPFGFKEDKEVVRAALNPKLPALAEEYGAEFFDFAALLCDESEPAVPLYGGHPNDEGCQIVADAFMKQFGDSLRGE